MPLIETYYPRSLCNGVEPAVCVPPLSSWCTSMILSESAHVLVDLGAVVQSDGLHGIVTLKLEQCPINGSQGLELSTGWQLLPLFN